MGVKQNFRIVGSGSYLPQACVSAEEMDVRLGLPKGWCQSHVGVKRRYECRHPETLVTMAGRAIAEAMFDAGVGWSNIDAIIDCSTSQYRPIPCNAAHHQQHVGAEASGIACFDVNSTCLGVPVALNLINGMFLTGAYRHVLLIASESGLGGVNAAEPESAALIGDGAAALVVRCEQGTGSLVFAHETFAEHLELCRVEGGGHKLPVFEYSPQRRGEYQFSMDGPSVFRVALRKLKPMVARVLDELRDAQPSLERASLHYVPHQASPKALEVVRTWLGVAPGRFHVAVDEVGNMIAASIPFMIDRLRKRSVVKAGDTLVLLGTSAGYSQAALVFEL
ncbi:MAG: 3-oxoacyl-[acyl-carrier-protein] synthase III C-terminal domain-containing protein [Aureliella sp.]